LPRVEAKKIAGNKLTTADLNAIVNAPENLMPLPKHLNSSKGKKIEYSNSGWVQYGSKGNPIAINSTYKQKIEVIQRQVRKETTDAIELKEKR
jgi:hypothetical protein